MNLISYRLIDSVGGWNLSRSPTSNSIRPRFDLYNFDLRRKVTLVQRFTTNALFDWYVREGVHDAGQYELFVHQGEKA